jgi:hypothetical protein
MWENASGHSESTKATVDTLTLLADDDESTRPGDIGQAVPPAEEEVDDVGRLD